MTFHAFTEYIKYRLKAKTRHGVHSPFVYQLIEKVLRDKSNTPLHDKLASFLGTDRLVLLAASQPGTWAKAIGQVRDKETVLIIPAIHKTAAHSRCWDGVASDPQVKLSIDLYQTGLLFFKDEFKEKQHFVLKYPY